MLAGTYLVVRCGIAAGAAPITSMWWLTTPGLRAALTRLSIKWVVDSLRVSLLVGRRWCSGIAALLHGGPHTPAGERRQEG